MSRIESDALNLLLSRRDSLRRAPEPPPPDPAASWRDWESIPSPAAESLRTELEEIEAALRRIEQGSYGTCAACGGPLGLQRLRAIPEARYCLGCSGHRDAMG